jgi:hypothetical protein
MMLYEACPGYAAQDRAREAEPRDTVRTCSRKRKVSRVPPRSKWKYSALELPIPRVSVCDPSGISVYDPCIAAQLALGDGGAYARRGAQSGIGVGIGLVAGIGGGIGGWIESLRAVPHRVWSRLRCCVH